MLWIRNNFVPNPDPDQLVSYPELPGSGMIFCGSVSGSCSKFRIRPDPEFSGKKTTLSTLVLIQICIGMPWMLMPIRIMIRYNDADPTRSGLHNTETEFKYYFRRLWFYLFEKDQFFTKIVRACGGNDSKFRKNIRHDLFFFI